MWTNKLPAASTAIALLLLPSTNAWNLTTYSDSSCEDYSGTADGTGNAACAATPGEHRSFEIHDMGDCVFTVYNSVADCNSGNSVQFYDSSDEDTCIPPDFLWDGYNILGC
jgi:hypothetical protein